MHNVMEKDTRSWTLTVAMKPETNCNDHLPSLPLILKSTGQRIEDGHSRCSEHSRRELVHFRNCWMRQVVISHDAEVEGHLEAADQAFHRS
jgi:hypothetical protein